MWGQTPWQTVGPFFHFALTWKGGADLQAAPLNHSQRGDKKQAGARLDLLTPGHDHLRQHPAADEANQADAEQQPIAGSAIAINGLLLDGNGDAVPDAMLEFWHADQYGHFPADMSTYGRCATDPNGGYELRTFRPGPVTDAAGNVHAPHIWVGIYARGIIKRLQTRIYFKDAPENQHDPVLSEVPEHRKQTLVASQTDDQQWCLDLVLQGEDETVFFQC